MANDKDSCYGFSPINVVCAVLNDGTIAKNFVEFNIVNHFLKDKDGISACEVVQCILIDWIKENKDIKDFDIETIDAELAKIESDFIEKQKLQEKENKDEDTK